MSRYPGKPGKFLDNVETFLIICKLSDWSEKFLNSLKMICKLFCCKNDLHTFLSQKWCTPPFFVAKTIYSFFCREHDLRTSPGNFWRVEVCQLESFDILGLCPWGPERDRTKGWLIKSCEKKLEARLKVQSGRECRGTVIFSLIRKTLLLSPVKMSVPPKKMANGPFSRNGTFPPSFWETGTQKIKGSTKRMKFATFLHFGFWFDFYVFIWEYDCDC